MKVLCKAMFLVLVLTVGVFQAFGATPATTAPFTECPAIGADTSCGILVLINPSGSVTVLADGTQGPYDGSDDTLVGVYNSSSSSVPSVNLSSTTLTIHNFDGDGNCTYTPFTGSGYCSSLPSSASGYEGPTTTFTNISTDTMSGTVVFTGGLAAGGTTYFSLEDALTAASFTGTSGTPTTPAPPALLLLLTGLAALGMWQLGRRFAGRAI